MFLYVIETANYNIFLIINFYIIGCLGKKKIKNKYIDIYMNMSGVWFIILIMIYYKTRDPKIC